MNSSWNRPLGVFAAVLFGISSVFPMVAGFVKNPAGFPKIWGELDVALAFVLALVAFVVMGVGRKLVDSEVEAKAYRGYRALIHGVFAMLLVFFLAGNRIVGSQCLTGFAWRAWLLLYALPEWIAVVIGRLSSLPTAGTRQ